MVDPRRLLSETVAYRCAVGECRWECDDLRLMLAHARLVHHLWDDQTAQLDGVWAGHADSLESYTDYSWHYVCGTLAFKSEMTRPRVGEDKEMWDAFAGGES